MATWNPAKDPRYADLYDGGGSSFAQTFLAAQDAIAKQEYNDLLLEEKTSALEDKKKSRNARSAMSQALLQGGDSADFYDSSMRALAEAGDLEGALQMAEAKRKFSGDEDPSKELAQIQALTKIGESNPELASQLWNSSRIGKKYGMKDTSTFVKKEGEEIKGDFIYSKDPLTGEIQIKKDLRRPTKGEKPEKPRESWKNYVDPQGKMVMINPYDPAQRTRVEQEGLKPYSSSSSGPSAVDRLNQYLGEDPQKEDTGSVMSWIMNKFSPSSPAPQRKILIK